MSRTGKPGFSAQISRQWPDRRRGRAWWHAWQCHGPV